MEKIRSLRLHILKYPGDEGPGIQAENLDTFVERGHIESAPHGTNRNYRYVYTASVILKNYAGRADRLFFWILDWLRTNQPDHKNEAFQFQVDILNADTVDLSVSVPLTETVIVEGTPGDITLRSAAEPDVTDRLTGNAWQLHINESETPAAAWESGPHRG